MRDLTILVSTMTGTAEMIAEDMIASLSKHYRPTLILAEKATVEIFLTSRWLLVVSSTYGVGEVPDPAKPLYAALSEGNLRLEGVNYGVVSLGDQRVYPSTFANGGKLWDEALNQRGAVRLTETLLLDASATYDMTEEALAWTTQWMDASNTQLTESSSGSPQPS